MGVHHGVHGWVYIPGTQLPDAAGWRHARAPPTRPCNAKGQRNRKLPISGLTIYKTETATHRLASSSIVMFPRCGNIPHHSSPLLAHACGAGRAAMRPYRLAKYLANSSAHCAPPCSRSRLRIGTAALPSMPLNCNDFLLASRPWRLSAFVVVAVLHAALRVASQGA